MTHPPTFWNDILKRPLDDAPRLRYAAWLDDRCDPLGEFIRVQCRLAGPIADGACLAELEDRERELLAEFESEWALPLADKVSLWVFRRGFVHEVATTVEKFLAKGAELFRLAPIQEVHLDGLGSALESLIASDHLERASYLDLSNNPVRDQGARRLAGCQYLAKVRGLNLSSSGIGDGGLKALAYSPHLGHLRELYLCDNRISNSGASALVRSPLADRLGLVHLRFNHIGTDGANLLQRRFGNRVCL